MAETKILYLMQKHDNLCSKHEHISKKKNEEDLHKRPSNPNPEFSRRNFRKMRSDASILSHSK